MFFFLPLMPSLRMGDMLPRAPGTLLSSGSRVWLKLQNRWFLLSCLFCCPSGFRWLAFGFPLVSGCFRLASLCRPFHFLFVCRRFLFRFALVYRWELFRFPWDLVPSGFRFSTQPPKKGPLTNNAPIWPIGVSRVRPSPLLHVASGVFTPH